MTIHKKRWLFALNIIMGLTLSGCAARIHKPKQPSTYPRILVNKHIPEELQDYIKYRDNDRTTKN